MDAEIDAGTIGQPRAMHASFYAGHLWPGGWRAWQLSIERCGGHLIHNGIHMIDLATWLMRSTPARVFARGVKTFAPGMPTPDSFHVLVRFENGAMATLEWSYALHRRGDLLRRIVVIGSQGTLHHSTQGEIDISSDATRPTAIATLDAFDSQMRHFLDVLEGAAPMVTSEQIRGAFAAAHAAQESFATGRSVALGAVVGETAR
jgi:predicted dehydrogenase